MNARGLTLLEMLIAMALTGVVAYIALDMFAGQQANYTRTREKVKLQDDAREAMRIIEQDVRNAGFRTTVASEPSGLAGAVASCNANLLDADSAAFTATNSNSLSGDAVRIRYLEPDPTSGLVVCGYGSGSAFREIGYRQRGDTLQRMLRRDTTTEPVWVDLLYNVVTFQVEYGLLVDPGDQLATASQLSDPAKWAGSAGASASASSGVLSLSGWTSSSVFAYYSTPVYLDPRFTYRIALDIAMNPAMRLGADAIDSNVVTKLPRFSVGFYTATGTVTSAADTMYAYPGDGSQVGNYRHVELYVSPGTTGNRYLGFSTSLKPGAATPSSPAQAATIRNASLSIRSRGQYYVWVDDPTAAQRRLVKALRINLLASSAKDDHEEGGALFEGLDASGTLQYAPSGSDANRSHVLYQRIVPVVNNGN